MDFLIFNHRFLDLRPDGGIPPDVGFSFDEGESTLGVASNSSSSKSGSGSFSIICLILEMRSCFLVLIELMDDDVDSSAITDFVLSVSSFILAGLESSFSLGSSLVSPSVLSAISVHSTGS